jgi:hypothetical protein
MRSIVLKQHVVSSIQQNKILTAHDDKRKVLEDGIYTGANRQGNFWGK